MELMRSPAHERQSSPQHLNYEPRTRTRTSNVERRTSNVEREREREREHELSTEN